MEKESITRRLARLIHNISYDALPDAVTHRAKLILIDTLGATIHGRDMACPHIALELIRSNKGNATAIGYNLQVPPLDAAFVNSVMAASTSLDDFQFTYHPGQVAVPAAIAIAEERGSSGVELISAIVAGYEAMGRICLGGPNIAPRFRALGAYGPFGSAAAAGKLFTLNEDQMTSALGLAANTAAGLTQCWIDGTMEGNFHGGMLARNGMTAAYLSHAGAIASEKSLEGDRGYYQAYAGTTEDAANALVDLGKRFLIMEASYKPYPVCALQQVPIDLLSDLVKRHHIKPENIQEIVEKVSEWEAAFPGSDFAGPYENADQTLLSSQFCAASTCLGKPVGSCSFYRDSYADQEILALAQKVKVVGEKDRKEPQITVTLYSGETYTAEQGEENETLVPADKKISDKFVGLTLDYLGEKRAKEFIDQVMSIEKTRDVRELIKQLRT
jgi:2-methylcitrate dehydratase PrpD